MEVASGHKVAVPHGHSDYTTCCLTVELRIPDVWQLRSISAMRKVGQAIRAFSGHTDYGNAVCLLPNDAFVTPEAGMAIQVYGMWLLARESVNYDEAVKTFGKEITVCSGMLNSTLNTIWVFHS